MDPAGDCSDCQGRMVASDAGSERTCRQPVVVDNAPKYAVDKEQVRKNRRGWRKIVRNFTPSWFSVNMGTGVVSILLHNLLYNGKWLYWISVVIFCLNVVLFVLFFCISILRYTLYPAIWNAMIRHPTQSLFLGTFPMGLATIVNMVVFVCVPAWGYRAVQLAWALWWIDAVIALSVCLYLPFVIMYFHTTDLKTVTAAWLLPIVAPIVAAATGGIVADVLPNPQHALITVIVSYVLWGTGVPLAMAVLVVYFQRLTIYKLPPREVIVSVFLPIGPLGQGGFAIQKLGLVAMKVFPITGTLSQTTTQSGDILYVLGYLIALIMWGFGLVWMFFAFASISRQKFPFNMGWWGFTFPLGVFATSTVQMGNELPSAFFRILGTILSVVVTLLWIIVAVGTVRKAATGELFFAPCLKDVEGKEEHGRKLFGGKQTETV
ncbi:C4-dicarboxylate transporter/malic acid transport protein-like protein [Calycina marina]|uniref:Sulfite efflux pump SSU1 n=1 Tax=Calycina marina TaxID=1763456 RepID=A0A9P7YWL8_9HELO|nr:C4-dicarboxylate transporter/malic acid transport protein-like protein [Calycina marina]